MHSHALTEVTRIYQKTNKKIIKNNGENFVTFVTCSCYLDSKHTLEKVGSSSPEMLHA